VLHGGVWVRVHALSNRLRNARFGRKTRRPVSELCDTIGRGDRTVDDVAGELFDATESDRDEQIAGRNVHVTTVGGESDDDADAERRRRGRGATTRSR